MLVMDDFEYIIKTGSIEKDFGCIGTFEYIPTWVPPTPKNHGFDWVDIGTTSI